MLVVDTYKRYTAAEALDHPFITQLRHVTIPRPVDEALVSSFEDLKMNKPLRNKDMDNEVSSSIDTVLLLSPKTKSKDIDPAAVEKRARNSDPKEKAHKNLFADKVNRLASWIKGSTKKV